MPASWSDFGAITPLDHSVFWIQLFDAFVRSHPTRHPGEPRIESGAGAGVQKFLVLLDSGVRRNDAKGRFSTIYGFIRYISLFNLLFRLY